jgi:NADH dehydrogenase
MTTQVSKHLPRVLILGGGFGGLVAARALRYAPVRVTLVDRQNHHVFQPLLYQVATAGLEAPDIGYPLRTAMRRQRNADVLMAEAERIDPTTRTVYFTNGNRLDYDYLIVCTGVESSYFGHSEWQANAPGLKSIDEAMEIRSRVLTAFERAEQESDPDARRALLNFIVVGGGPTGVELAGAISELARHSLKRDFRKIDPTQARVLLFEAGPAILPTYPADLQGKAVSQLQHIGVEVHTSTRVQELDEHGVIVDGARIAARTVLWAAGVAATPIARSLGVRLDRHGRVPVTSTLHPEGLREVFVIGDLASLTQDGHPVPGVAPAAIQMGRHAARAIIRELEGKPIEPFHYRNKGELATIGRSAAVAVFPENVKLSGFIAWLSYLMVHLVYLAGLSARVKVFASWVWSFFTYGRGARLIQKAPPEPAGPPALPTEPPEPRLAVEEQPPAPSLH